jgi:hypothetical protein
MKVVPVIRVNDAEQAQRLVRLLGETPLAIRMPGPVAAEIPSSIVGHVLGAGWTVLVGGWSDPILASLPESSRRLQLEREIDWWRRSGVDHLAGWVDEGWEPSLVATFTLAGLDQVFVRWPDPIPPGPVMTDYTGDSVVVFPLGSPVVPILLDPAELVGSPVPPGEMLDPPLPRMEPPVDRAWVASFAGDPEVALLYRKMLRLARRLPERIPAEVVEWLCLAQSAGAYRPGVDRTFAHAALAAARHRLDLGRRRPSEWTRLSVLDWDADGVDEVQVETQVLSLVVDPGAGLLTYIDHKPAERAVNYIPGQAPWHLAQVLVGDHTHRLALALGGVEEVRDRAAITSTGDGIAHTVAIAGSTLSLHYRLTGDMGYERLGLEMALAFFDPITLRVDGAAWEEISAPSAVAGHRFRLQAGSAEILIALDQPGDLFLRPVPGGLVAWANWPLVSPLADVVENRVAEYRMTVEIIG